MILPVERCDMFYASARLLSSVLAEFGGHLRGDKKNPDANYHWHLFKTCAYVILSRARL